MEKITNTVRELTSAELDEVGGGGNVSVNLGGLLKGIDKLGGQLEGDLNKFLSSVEKQVGSFLGSI